MYEEALPVARGETPCANSENAMPYSSQLAIVETDATQMARAGTRGTAMVLPLMRPASVASFGTAIGAARRATPPRTAIAMTASSAVSPRAFEDRAPTAAPTFPAAVSAITANPAMMLTRFTTRLDPIAAAAETPLFWAIAPIAAICHTLPGMYFPRLETNQILADVPKGSDSDHTRSVARHASTR